MMESMLNAVTMLTITITSFQLSLMLGRGLLSIMLASMHRQAKYRN